MAIVKLQDSSLPAMWAKMIYDRDSFVISASHCEKIATVLFTGAMTAVAAMRSKEFPTAYTFEDANGTFLGGAVLRWIPEEKDENQPGHWNVVWVMEKEDVPEDARVNSVTNPMTWNYFRGFAGKKYGMGFDPNSEGTLVTRLLACINQWLDDNASEDEIVGIEVPGVFEAKVEVEDGEKIKAIDIVGETKALVKYDAGNEV